MLSLSGMFISTKGLLGGFSRQLRIEFPGSCYHIMNRGNDRQSIFEREEDYKLFIDKLGEFSENYKIATRSFCLMQNHFHLYVCTPEGNLSRFMQSFSTSFTVTKNRRDRRRRHLFQGRFRALLVEDEGYGSEVSRYIHLNPVMTRSIRRLDMEKQVEKLNNYKWSSYRSISGLQSCPKWLDGRSILCRWGRKRGEQKKNYSDYVKAGLLKNIEDPFAVAAARSVLGSESFVEKYRRGLTTLSEKLNIRREQVQGSRLHSWQDLGKLIGTISQAYRVPEKALLSRYYRGNEARQVLFYFASKYCRGRYSLTELSDKFGITLGGFSSSVYKLRERFKTDKKLSGKIKKLEELLK